jgi:hypothetical protein
METSECSRDLLDLYIFQLCLCRSTYAVYLIGNLPLAEAAVLYGPIGGDPNVIQLTKDLQLYILDVIGSPSVRPSLGSLPRSPACSRLLEFSIFPAQNLTLGINYTHNPSTLNLRLTLRPSFFISCFDSERSNVQLNCSARGDYI